MKRRPVTLLAGAAALPLIALAFAGCGGNSGAKPTAASGTPKTAFGTATVGAQNEGNLGTVLVDAQGRTLYLFQKDSGTQSTCLDTCARYWPPARASGKATAGNGLNPSLLGTTPRSDGGAQVTYNSHPLYQFSGDQNPGDTSGQGLTDFGGSWSALSAAGNQVTGHPASSSGGSGY